MEYRAVKIILATFLAIAFAVPFLPKRSPAKPVQAYTYTKLVKVAPTQTDRLTATGAYPISSDSLRFVGHDLRH